MLKIIPSHDRLILNTLRQRQDGRHFPESIFKCIFFHENVSISINISLKFVPRSQINNILALVQVMVCCWPGNKPLSEPMMVILPTYICVTRPQWVNMGIPIPGKYGLYIETGPCLYCNIVYWVIKCALMAHIYLGLKKFVINLRGSF